MSRGRVGATIGAVIGVILIVFGGFWAGHLLSGGSVNSLVTGDGRAELLALKTVDYEQKSVAEFNEAFRPVAHLYSGYGPGETEPAFMQVLLHSSMELLAEENQDTPYLGLGHICGDFELDYRLEWTLDSATVTVAEREKILAASERDAVAYFSSLSGDELREADALAQLQTQFDHLSTKHSTASMTVKLSAEAISY